MLDLFTIATKAPALCEAFNAQEEDFEYTPAYQVRPKMTVPIFVGDGETVNYQDANWGLQLGKGKSWAVSTVDMDKILRKKPYNILIRKQRCIVPANCFYGIREGEPFLVKLLQQRVFGMAGIWQETKGAGGPTVEFALLTTEAPDILAPYMKEMPVLFEAEQHKNWLKDTSLRSVMKFADRSGLHWFDMHQVAKEILSSTDNKKELLKPLFPSAQRSKEAKMNAIELEQYRTKRGK